MRWIAQWLALALVVTGLPVAVAAPDEAADLRRELESLEARARALVDRVRRLAEAVAEGSRGDAPPPLPPVKNAGAPGGATPKAPAPVTHQGLTFPSRGKYSHTTPISEDGAGSRLRISADPVALTKDSRQGRWLSAAWLICRTESYDRDAGGLPSSVQLEAALRTRCAGPSKG
jgi:hypothetical protein